ncbi:hypothetical protein AAE478_003225 [Parahypoxylon ruwenzoriense]
MEVADANKRGEIIISTPKWFIALRVFQIVIALIIVALTGWWIHGLYYDELGFVIVCGVFTWIIAIYALLAEKVLSCRRAYNTWAILALDLLMIIFWLAAMGATANRRGQFTVPVTATCVSDGSAINSGHCTVWKRAGVASLGALDILSSIAGLSALVMLLFVATFAYVCHYFRLSFVGYSINDPEKITATVGVTQGGVAGVPDATELQAGITPQNVATQQPQPFLHQQPDQQWAQQTAYAQQPVGGPQFQQGTVHDPYTQQNTGYTGPAGVYPTQQVGSPYDPHSIPAPNQPYSPQGSPAPGQPYQPPLQ